MPTLFNYQKHRNTTNNSRTAPAVANQFSIYIELSEKFMGDDPIVFWSKHQSELPQLACYAFRILSIPASSSAVERVFSYGGLIIRPNRATMTDDLLSSLIFLKCNSKS